MDDLKKSFSDLSDRCVEELKENMRLRKRNKELEAALQRINNRLNDDDSWLAQSIDCRNIAESALGGEKWEPA